MNNKTKKFDCWTCKYRGFVPGSAHICCEHPSVSKAKNDSFGNVLAIFASVGRCAPVIADSKELNIKGNSHGIKSGWFNWPYNFDPTWLTNCEGYKSK